MNGDRDVENGLVDTVRKGESGANGESSTDICALPCVEQTAGEKLLRSTGSPARSSATTWGRCEWEGGDIRIIMADLHC